MESSASSPTRDIGRWSEPADPSFHIPFDSERRALAVPVRLADASPSAVIGAIRAAVREADPNQPIARIRNLHQSCSPRAWRRACFNTPLVGLFVITVLLLAAARHVRRLAFSVASRTRELGVRSALGATPASRHLVFGQGAGVGGLAVAMASAWHGSPRAGRPMLTR